MAVLKLLVTEKSMKLSKQNTYVLVSDDIHASINKIELAKKLLAAKYEVESVRIVHLPKKQKTKYTGQRRIKTSVARGKKYYVTLKDKKQKIDEKFELAI